MMRITEKLLDTKPAVVDVVRPAFSSSFRARYTRFQNIDIHIRGEGKWTASPKRTVVDSVALRGTRPRSKNIIVLSNQLQDSFDRSFAIHGVRS